MQSSPSVMNLACLHSIYVCTLLLNLCAIWAIFICNMFSSSVFLELMQHAGGFVGSNGYKHMKHCEASNKILTVIVDN